jgi:hypothetical protein
MENFYNLFQEEIDSGLIDFKVAIGNKDVSLREVEDSVMRMLKAVKAGMIAPLPESGLEPHPRAVELARTMFP